MLNAHLLAAYRTFAVILASPATRVRTALLSRDAVTNAHISDVARRLRRSLASRPRQLSPEQLTALGTMAAISGDAELRAASAIAPWSTSAMAMCVAAQDKLNESVAIGRLVQAQAARTVTNADLYPEVATELRARAVRHGAHNFATLVDAALNGDRAADDQIRGAMDAACGGAWLLAERYIRASMAEVAL